MARTDVDTVKSITQTGLTDAAINLIIGHANLMVTRTLGGEGLTDALLADIEMWMTAHLIAVGKERWTKEEQVGEIWLKYQENPKGFLESTNYGMTVLFLDTSGKMQEATMKKARFRAIPQFEDDE